MGWGWVQNILQCHPLAAFPSADRVIFGILVTGIVIGQRSALCGHCAERP